MRERNEPAAPSKRERGTLPERRKDTSQEAELLQREALLSFLDRAKIEPAAALEVIATYEAPDAADHRLEDLRLIASDFGLELDALDAAERNELVVLYLAADAVASETGKAETARAMNELLREKLVETTLSKIDTLRVALEASKDVEAAKDVYREVMRSIVSMAKQMPPGIEAHDPVWLKLTESLRSTLAPSNRDMLPAATLEALQGVPAEFESEIEDEFFNREVNFRKASGRDVVIEDIMADLYGRTPDEIERLKARNRAETVAEMARMKDDPEISVETLERLYAMNNRDIVPKTLSRLRKEKEKATFGKRVGLLAEDVRPEIEALLGRAEALIGREIVKGVPRPVFEIAAAGMHNDLLEIHPFPDRNGSTALLFLEFLMSKKGYVPDPERPESYYGQLREVLGNNPVALGVVAFEHFKIGYVSGHYESKAIMDDETKRQVYKTAVGKLSRKGQKGK